MSGSNWRMVLSGQAAALGRYGELKVALHSRHCSLSNDYLEALIDGIRSQTTNVGFREHQFAT